MSLATDERKMSEKFLEYVSANDLGNLIKQSELIAKELKRAFVAGYRRGFVEGSALTTTRTSPLDVN